MAIDLNVRATILITRDLPGTGTLKAPGTIWWLGDRFHVRDESGLPLDDVLALASSPRGFGREPRTKEEFMDTRVRYKGVTDFYGHRGTGRGTVIEDGVTAEVAADALLPFAELVLAGDVSGLTPTGRAKLLGRDAVEYTTTLASRSDVFISNVRRVVSGPYVLLREVADSEDPKTTLRVETVSLDEGVVRPEDVRTTDGRPA